MKKARQNAGKRQIEQENQAVFKRAQRFMDEERFKPIGNDVMHEEHGKGILADYSAESRDRRAACQILSGMHDGYIARRADEKQIVRGCPAVCRKRA